MQVEEEELMIDGEEGKQQEVNQETNNLKYTQILLTNIFGLIHHQVCKWKRQPWKYMT